MELKIMDYLTKKTVKVKVAKTIILAQNTFEDSWNCKAYSFTRKEAAEKAVESMKLDNFWVDIIAHLIKNRWNDAALWAEQVIKSSKK